MVLASGDVSFCPRSEGVLVTLGRTASGHTLVRSFSGWRRRRFSHSPFSSMDYRAGRFLWISGRVLCLSHWVRSLVCSSGSRQVASTSSLAARCAIGGEEPCVGKSRLIRLLVGRSSELLRHGEVGCTSLWMGSVICSLYSLPSLTVEESRQIAQANRW